MDPFPAALFWLIVCSVPLGLAFAVFWARSYRRRKFPRVPPGEPGNPV